ncbi:MAG: tRNA 5'-guanylyltransferase [Methanomicrobiales archaeon]|nr:tRNA 5'-guanylyltransferase [Methanomicrobiales archaeon]
MESREIFSGLATIPPVFLRLDGRAFHRLARSLDLTRPFDPRFCRAMAEVSERLVAESGLSPLFAYTFSDEISLYFATLPFSGRVEKLDSVAASYAASSLTLVLATSEPLAFDARVVQASPDYAETYLQERQAEAWRNHMNAWCQETLVREGMDPRKAADSLKGLPSEALHEMMFSRGMNLAKTPAWQRRGVLVYRKEEERAGYNPVTGEDVAALRRVVRVDPDPPLFTAPEGLALIRSLVRGQCP